MAVTSSAEQGARHKREDLRAKDLSQGGRTNTRTGDCFWAGDVSGYKALRWGRAVSPG